MICWNPSQVYNRFTPNVLSWYPVYRIAVSSGREVTITVNPTPPNHRIVLFIVLPILIFHAWLASYSREEGSGRTTYYYAYLSQAFLHGDLHLPLQPDPELLAMEDPYDVSARAELEKRGTITPVDFSLYKGRFYLYWGPVPALLLSSIQVFSQQPQPVADFFLAFLFGVGILLAQSLLLTAVWRQYFTALPAWAYYMVLFLAGLLWPAALLRHEQNLARVYEAAIAAGQFFLICGLWAAFIAIVKRSMPNWSLALAGCLWVLAIGSRQLLLVPISLMVILTSFWILRTQTAFFTKIVPLVCLTLPLAAGGALLAWYNWARFGSWSETGFFYALAGVDIQKHAAELFSSSNIIQNLYNYLLNPPHLTSTFPFASMLKGNKSPAAILYYAEPMTGLLYMFPFAVFAINPLVIYFLNRSKANQSANSGRENVEGPLHWITLNLIGSFLISFFLLMIFFWAGMRYAADFLPALTMLSSIGFWQGYQALGQTFRARNYYSIAGMILAGISIVVSTLLAISTI